MADLRSDLCQDVALSALTIPSTHNSHATPDNLDNSSVPFYTKFFTKFFTDRMTPCQQVGVEAQLKMGVRAFDFRLGPGLHLRHGRMALTQSLPDTLQVIHNFLAEHPHESVLIQAKWNMKELIMGKPLPPPADLRHQIEALFFSYSSAYTSILPPTLDSAGGKMLLKGGEGERGLLRPQKHFSSAPIAAAEPRERRWREVDQTLDWIIYNGDTTDGIWYNVGLCDFYVANNWKDVLTGSKAALIYPREFAEYENPRLIKYLDEKCSRSRRYRLGAVKMDFVYEELVQKLILTNFL